MLYLSRSLTPAQQHISTQARSNGGWGDGQEKEEAKGGGGGDGRRGSSLRRGSAYIQAK